ncbi:MAG: hypothetical protein NVSMB19_01750 [Vulcanimicrobiaceae bacterium]
MVDRDLTVILSGSTPADLMPAAGSRLEAALAAEVRALMNERWLRNGTLGLGLIGLDHAVRLIERPEIGTGYYLVCTERTSLRGEFERLVRRFRLNDEEAEFARMLIAGYPTAAIAIRLGSTPGDAARNEARLLEKMALPDRRALTELAFSRQRLQRARRPLKPAEAN